MNGPTNPFAFWVAFWAALPLHRFNAFHKRG